MDGLGISEVKQWSLSNLIGYDHPFLYINKHTLIYTWIVILLLTLCLIPIRYLVTHNKNHWLRNIAILYTKTFIDNTTQAFGNFYKSHTIFVAVLFTFIFICNTIALIPWLEEPTADLNTALALGIVSFMYIQITAINTHGFVAYIKSYFLPFIFMLPLNVIGKLASILSISFRLFGNIFGGAIISHIYLGLIEGSFIREVIGLLSGVNILVFLFFGLVEGALQAFVFSMLTLTYLAMAIQGEGGH